MGAKWMILLVSGCLVMSSALGETVPCMESRAECERVRFSSVSIINSLYLCCAPGYSMNVINTQCSCSRTGLAISCYMGPRACAGADSVSSDGQGNTLCCPSGFSISSVNGLTTRNCTCTQGGGGNSLVITGNGNRIGGDPASNGRLHRAYQNSMRALAESMQRLKTRMSNMRQRMATMFGNLFRG
ncbi:hypothetical protein ACOMHN_059450 [Nucella lapillus]